MTYLYSPVYDENGHLVGVTNNETGAVIPRDPANSDWQAFLDWNAANGYPISPHDLPPKVPIGPRTIDAIVADLQKLTAAQRNQLVPYTIAWMLQHNPTMATDIGLPVSGWGPQYTPGMKFQSTTGFAVAAS
jgi:hypothetical protein